MTRSIEKGREFEQEIAEELGLSLVPGSGNQWHSKLDLQGKEARWSLKYTDAKSYRLDQEDVDEAVEATQSLSGDGRVPLWLIRLQTEEYDLVVIRKKDFFAWKSGEINLSGDDKPKQSQVRRARARIPVLLRGEDGDN